jgi:hypothetical protein
VRGDGLEHKKWHPPLPLWISAYSINSISRSIVHETPHRPPFPTTGDCFSFEFRWILNSALVRVGQMGAACKILNACKKGKYLLPCWVRGCLMEGRSSCVPLIAEKSVYLNRYERDVGSSHRLSFRKYCGVTGIKVKCSNKCCWNVTHVSINRMINWFYFYIPFVHTAERLSL